MVTLTATLQNIINGLPGGYDGYYVILWSDGNYVSEHADQTDVRHATRFGTIIDAWKYLEASYPSNSTWRGQWVDSPDGLGQVFCITVD